MNTPISVLVVGCGHMGTSHALGYTKNILDFVDFVEE